MGIIKGSCREGYYAQVIIEVDRMQSVRLSLVGSIAASAGNIGLPLFLNNHSFPSFSFLFFADLQTIPNFVGPRKPSSSASLSKQPLLLIVFFLSLAKLQNPANVC